MVGLNREQMPLQCYLQSKGMGIYMQILKTMSFQFKMRMIKRKCIKIYNYA